MAWSCLSKKISLTEIACNSQYNLSNTSFHHSNLYAIPSMANLLESAHSKQSLKVAFLSVMNVDVWMKIELNFCMLYSLFRDWAICNDSVGSYVCWQPTCPPFSVEIANRICRRKVQTVTPRHHRIKDALTNLYEFVLVQTMLISGREVVSSRSLENEAWRTYWT